MADLPKSGSLLPGSNRNIFQVLFYSHLLGTAPGELEHGEATVGRWILKPWELRQGWGVGRAGSGRWRRHREAQVRLLVSVSVSSASHRTQLFNQTLI